MSATICYEPNAKTPKSIDTSAPSDFWKKLTECMGYIGDVNQLNLEEKDLPVLRALAIGAGESNPGFNELVYVVEKHGSIRLWREF